MNIKKNFLIKESETAIEEGRKIVLRILDLESKVEELNLILDSIVIDLEKARIEHENFFFSEDNLCFYLGFYLNETTKMGETIYKHTFYCFNCKQSMVFFLKSGEEDEYVSKAINVSDLFSAENLRWSDDSGNAEFNEKINIIDKIIFKTFETDEVTSVKQIKELVLKLFWRFRDDKEFEKEYFESFRRVLN